jgi:hypothetical protein
MIGNDELRLDETNGDLPPAHLLGHAGTTFSAARTRTKSTADLVRDILIGGLKAINSLVDRRR